MERSGETIDVATGPSRPTVVDTQLNYYLELVDGGVSIQYTGTAGDKRRPWKRTAVQITDIRGCESDYDLDKQGFRLVQHHSREQVFADEAKIRTDVYEETKQLLMDTTGATRVQPFSHIIRRDKWQAALDIPEEVGDMEIVTVMNPAMFVHVDQSYEGARIILKDNLPTADVSRLSETRWAIINVWRPLSVVRREPIGVCDARSVAESDLRAVTARLPQKGSVNAFQNVSSSRDQEIWNVAASPEHKWYFASQMTSEEALLIKCFDSKLDGRARRAPHSAFQMEKDEGPARQSIEVRCLVFWEDQNAE